MRGARCATAGRSAAAGSRSPFKWARRQQQRPCLLGLDIGRDKMKMAVLALKGTSRYTCWHSDAWPSAGIGTDVLLPCHDSVGLARA